MAGDRPWLPDATGTGPFCVYVAAFEAELARSRGSHLHRWFVLGLFFLGPGVVFATPLWFLVDLSPGAYLLAASAFGVAFMQLARSVCRRRQPESAA